MKQKWQLPASPTFAKIADGELVRLSLMLPSFDEETANLQELDMAGRVQAGWYEVTCPASGVIDPSIDNPIFYGLSSVDTVAGTCVLMKE